MWLRPFIACALAVSFSLLSSTAFSTERWVIQFKPGTFDDSQNLDSHRIENHTQQVSDKVSELARVHRQNLRLIRPFGQRGAVVIADSDEPAQWRQRLLSDPLVESVDEDRRIRLRAQSPLVGLLNA